MSLSRRGRGSSYDRRKRRAWLVSVYRLKGGMVACSVCGKLMRASGKVWQVDRYPIPGRMGGTYRRDNIRIACPSCNKRS